MVRRAAVLLLVTSLVGCKAADRAPPTSAAGSGSAVAPLPPHQPITGAPTIDDVAADVTKGDAADDEVAYDDSRAGIGRVDGTRRPPRRGAHGGVPRGPHDGFAMRLLRALPSATTNVAISPVAMAAALAMVASTAAGPSAGELVRLLELPPGDNLGTSLEPALQRLPWTASGPRADGGLRLANRLWIDGAETTAPVAADAVTRLRGSLDRLAVSADQRGARATIDRWISEQTDGALSGFLPEAGALAGSVLTSALALELVWKFAFDPARTTPTEFRGRTHTATVPMMTLTAPLRAARTDDAVLVEVPLAHGDLVVWLAIPTTDTGVKAIAALDADDLARWGDELAPAVVALRLPRLALADTLDLTPTLRELGAAAVFSAQAELPGLRPAGAASSLGFNFRSNDRPRLTSVLHQSRVAWSEVGLAPPALAAATTLDPEAPSASVAAPPITALADRPFLFLVRDATTGTVVVVGRVVEPPA